METLISHTLITGGIIFLFVTLIFVLAQTLKDNSVMDIFYGPTFVVGALGFTVVTQQITLLSTIILICLTLWATRLSLRIAKKNAGKPEDARYGAWRESWMQKGTAYFLVRSYLQINVLQGFIILLILVPFILSTTSTAIAPLFILAGAAVFLFGLAYESIADYQLDQFIAGKKSGNESAILMTKGLFALSRRPNYFGESLIWWGQAIMVLSLPYGWIGLLSPLVITYVVTKITGPMLEKQFLSRYPEEYKRYMETTSYFIPWFKKE